MSEGMNRRGRGRTLLVWSLIIAGAVQVASGVGGAIHLRLTHPEKRAYYMLGHWWQADAQVHVPLIVFGVVVLVAAWLLGRGPTEQAG